ncbi:phage portal protein [Dehalobacter restrictus]|uniref:phage portal protein n=1 Tax=Dehalobacter restrictus TaxID=55583 RepID=UPI00338D7B2B
MNISAVIDYLNKTYSYDLTGEYYDHIMKWKAWWKGYHKPFHQYFERGYNSKLIERKLYTLKMAKKVCEDWASILLNEKTEIVIKDEPGSLFILGEEENSDDGVFQKNSFWMKANELVEKAFYSGTGAFVLRLEGMKILGEKILKDSQTKIRIEYLTALNIVPLTVKRGKVIDVAFVSEVLQAGEKYIYIETHMLKDGSYSIRNQYFKEEEGILQEKPLPEGILPEFSTGSDIPLFAILRPNIVNNIDETTGLGISVYADAIDNLEGVDLAFNNFCRDFKLGGKKVFLNEQLTQTDENGITLTPDDVAQQLFVGMGDGYIDKDGNNKLIHEFNPALRVDENKDGIQGQLDYLSFKCGLGTKHYQFNAGSIVTATQYMGDKQELVQNASKHYIVVEETLKSLVKSILWVGKEVVGVNVKVDSLITITFDDSYIIDKESERLRDQQEIRDGLMQKWEYRVKWYGEDEDTAKSMVPDNLSDSALMGFGGGGGQ